MIAVVLLLLLQDIDSVREHLQSESYAVTWKSANEFDPHAELEIGSGTGHGLNLRWFRFRPTTDGIEILSISLEESREQYHLKWPPDRVPVKIQKAEMKLADYSAMLRQIAMVDAAELKPRKTKQDFSSSGSFWVHARLAVAEKTLVDLEFAGYQGSANELKSAKPKAMTTIALQAIKQIQFKDYVLTKEDRVWISAKFGRDWKAFLKEEFHWWVRERSIMLVGVVGDVSALPVLKEILGRDPKDRSVYYAINAITRLTSKDMREKPVEEMDVEKTRQRVLDLLNENP